MKMCRMECPYCGASIEADVENRKSVFCTYCGKQIKIENDPSNVTINQNINIKKNINQRVTNDAEILKEQNRHIENKWDMILTCVLLAIVFGITLFLYIRIHSNAAKETNVNVQEEKVDEADNKEILSDLQEEKDKSEDQSKNYEKEDIEESMSSSDQDRQQIQLADSGYTVETSGGYVIIYYAVKIKNPNKDFAVEFPTIRITARSADDTILKTYDQVLFFIDANETILYAGKVLYEGKLPNSVIFSVSNKDHNYIQHNGSKACQRQFDISNLSVNKGNRSRTFTGEITNNSNEDLNTAAVTVIFLRGNKMVGGATDYVDQLKSGATEPFEVDDSSSIQYDSYKVYGLPW